METVEQFPWGEMKISKCFNINHYGDEMENGRWGVGGMASVNARIGTVFTYPECLFNPRVWENIGPRPFNTMALKARLMMAQPLHHGFHHCHNYLGTFPSPVQALSCSLLVIVAIWNISWNWQVISVILP